MTFEFKLPDLGEGVAEGEIVKWLVSEGQQIKEDEPMVEVMTDKATVQIPSPSSGTVKHILAKEGQTVKVGTGLVILESGNGKDGGSKPAQETSKSPEAQILQKEMEKPLQQAGLKPPQTQEAKQTQRPIATPATRRLARDLGIDIENLQGSGVGGRITEDDVRAAAKGGIRQAPEQQMAPPYHKMQPATQPIQGISQSAVTSPSEERFPIHGIRKRISDKMLRSSQTTAPVTHVEEIDFTELIALRESTKPLAENQKVKLTYLPFIMKAVILALKQFPYFNASIDDEKQEFVVKHYYNIGFATDTPNGLIVPVVKKSDKKNIFQIAAEIERLAEQAREGKIQLQDIQGGTFTITNIGTLGGIISTPIINLPEVAILGVHKIQKRPVVVEDKIVIRERANVALTFDHRIVDGADAARFTTKLKQYLENPSLIFVEESLQTA